MPQQLTNTLRVHYEDKKYPVPANLNEMEFESLTKIADGVVVCQQHSKDRSQNAKMWLKPQPLTCPCLKPGADPRLFGD
jgi:hypothetical protein